jgi:hypothetical protein
VARRVFAFVGLGLDDDPADAFVEQATADQVRRDVMDAANEKVSLQPLRTVAFRSGCRP